ncbi:hypothetical protein EC07798_2711, partial [Escherichia coli 07798]
DYGRP